MDVIIILGSPNDEHGNLSSISKERCYEGIKYFNKNPKSKVLCTGGFGDHFNATEIAHGEYAKQFLISHGIPEEAILDVAESSFTIEDATKSIKILEKIEYDKMILITSDYHMKRASLIFNHFYQDVIIEESPSLTNLPKQIIEKLYQHEEKAILRDESNLKKMCK